MCVYGSWRMLEPKDIERKLESCPRVAQEKYDKWIDVIEQSGPQGLRQIRGFRDEALKCQWKGHRSSRLNLQYRIIYLVKNDEVVVRALDITQHDCRKK